MYFFSQIKEKKRQEAYETNVANSNNHNRYPVHIVESEDDKEEIYEEDGEYENGDGDDVVTASDDNNNYDDDEEYQSGRDDEDDIGKESKLDERELAMLRSNNVSCSTAKCYF